MINEFYQMIFIMIDFISMASIVAIAIIIMNIISRIYFALFDSNELYPYWKKFITTKL